MKKRESEKRKGAVVITIAYLLSLYCIICARVEHLGGIKFNLSLIIPAILHIALFIYFFHFFKYIVDETKEKKEELEELKKYLKEKGRLEVKYVSYKNDAEVAFLKGIVDRHNPQYFITLTEKDTIKVIEKENEAEMYETEFSDFEFIFKHFKIEYDVKN